MDSRSIVVAAATTSKLCHATITEKSIHTIFSLPKRFELKMMISFCVGYVEERRSTFFLVSYTHLKEWLYKQKKLNFLHLIWVHFYVMPASFYLFCIHFIPPPLHFVDCSTIDYYNLTYISYFEFKNVRWQKQY